VKTSSSSAVYVYCIFRAARRARGVEAPAGVPDATAPALHAIARGTWLATSTVPLDVYGPANLEPRLRDLDWVARVAFAHEAVNEFFGRAPGAVVVPMKLFTMFSSLEKAIEDVRARRKAIDIVVRRVSGCEEWGVRVTRQSAKEPSDGRSRPTTGAEFLQARKAARDAASTARTTASGAADAAFDRLKGLSKDANRRSGGAEPGTNPPILEAAFLVPKKARATFTTEARRQTAILAKAGADLTLTGPWPAYSFVGEEA
jgi:gas vesicle protein GvpL/GvpF